MQSLLGPHEQRTLNRANTNIFANKIFCGHCKHALRRYGGLNPKYICFSNREVQRNQCFSDVIYEADVKEIVLAAVKQEVALALDSKKKIDKHNDRLFHERGLLSEQIRKLSADVQKLKNNRANLFEKYSDGKISKDQFLSLKLEQTGIIEKAETDIAMLSDELKEQNQSTVQSERFEHIKTFSKAKEVTAEMMALVDSIYVFDSNHIEIKLAFSDGLSRARDR